jgi:N-acetylneuraminic acid mutarotase
MKSLSVGIIVLLVAAILVSGCSSSSSTASDNGPTSVKAPVERTGGSAENVNEKIYLIGGMDIKGKTLNIVEEYDPGKGTWVTKTPMPTARYGAESVVWNDEIYVIGGRDGNLILSTVEKYNSATDRWTTLRSMPTGRWNPMIEVMDGKIYAIGGISGTGDNRKTLATVEVYSIKDNIWSSLPDAPFSRQNGASAVIGDAIYIISGRAGTGEGPSTDPTVNKFDTTSGRWTSVASLPEGRTGVRGATISKGVIVVAGGASTNLLLPGVLVYSPQSNRWEQKFSLRVPRTGNCCVVIGNTFYVLSGLSSADPVRMTTDVESFTIT